MYLDDIIVMGKTFAEHLNNSDLVFSRIEDAWLKITRKVLEVRYLGTIVSKDGIAADPEKTAKVQQWPRPIQ